MNTPLSAETRLTELERTMNKLRSSERIEMTIHEATALIKCAKALEDLRKSQKALIPLSALDSLDWLGQRRSMQHDSTAAPCLCPTCQNTRDSLRENNVTLSLPPLTSNQRRHDEKLGQLEYCVRWLHGGLDVGRWSNADIAASVADVLDYFRTLNPPDETSEDPLLRESAERFHSTYCPTCPDNPCSLGIALRTAPEASEELTVKFPRAWAPYLQAVILGALDDFDNQGDCRWHLNELQKFLGRASEKTSTLPAIVPDSVLAQAEALPGQ